MQGGNSMTTYAPTYSWASSERKGFVLKNHTEIGHVDFRASDSFSILLWKTDHLNINQLLCSSMKDVVTGITHYAGRMKPLPKWT